MNHCVSSGCRSMSGETSPERMTGDSSGRDNNRNHTSRSGQGRNHRANSRDKNPNTSHQNKDQRGSSMDRNRRGNSQNRKRSNVSKDRNQGGYVGDRNQGDDKYNRNQHSNSHDKNIQAESQNQRRGISQDQNRHNTGQNRTQRNSSRERSGRSNSQIRNQRGGSQENQLFHRRNNTADTTSWRSSQDRETSLDRYPRNLRAPSKEKGDPWDRYHHRADSRERNNRGSGKETSLAGASRESINTRVRKEKSSQSVSVAEVGWVDKAAHKEHGRVSGRPSRPELSQEFGNQDVSSPGILVLPPPDMSVPPPSYQPVFRQLFDHNNPNKPIIVSSSPTNRNTSSTLAQNNRENEPVPDLLHSPGLVSYTGATPQLQELEEQFGNSRPSWYSPYSQSFRQAHSQRLILDIERADAELQWILSSGGILRDWNRIVYI
ncbi:unnamed protein product, partial [Timema podura]|nr:unnamed protein product [Timema podura]